LYRSLAGTYELAKSNTALSADVVGVVQGATSSKFDLIYSGILNIDSHGFIVGKAIYLDYNTEGYMTHNPPTADETISKPLGIVIDANNILVQPLRGIENETFEGGSDDDLAIGVKEVDGSPNVSNVTQFVFSNGSVTNDGNGQVTVDTGGTAKTDIVYAQVYNLSATWQEAEGTKSTVKAASADWGAFAFKTVTLSSYDTGHAIGADVIADSVTDTLTLSAGPNIALLSDPSTGTITISARVDGGSGGGGSGHTIQYRGTDLATRTNLNFLSSGGVVDPLAEDNSGNDATDVTIPNGFDIMMIAEIFR
jgi:hypothetical protein